MKASPHEIYRSMMLEVKIRIQAVEKVLETESSSNLYESLDFEFAFLQIRKIVELITLASVLCDEQRYKEFRKLEGEANKRDHGEYQKDWNSGVILNKLKNISPHFMPIPIDKCTKTGEGQYHFSKKTDVKTTHTKFIEIYKKCGGFLHIANPFGNDYIKHVSNQRQKYQTASETAKKYLTYIKSIIWCHAAVGLSWKEGENPSENANPNTAWIVDFEQCGTNNIKIIVGVGE